MVVQPLSYMVSFGTKSTIWKMAGCGQESRTLNREKLDPIGVSTHQGWALSWGYQQEVSALQSQLSLIRVPILGKSRGQTFLNFPWVAWLGNKAVEGKESGLCGVWVNVPLVRCSGQQTLDLGKSGQFPRPVWWCWLKPAWAFPAEPIQQKLLSAIAFVVAFALTSSSLLRVGFEYPSWAFLFLMTGKIMAGFKGNVAHLSLSLVCRVIDCRSLPGAEEFLGGGAFSFKTEAVLRKPI